MSSRIYAMIVCDTCGSVRQTTTHNTIVARERVRDLGWYSRRDNKRDLCPTCWRVEREKAGPLFDDHEDQQ